MAGDWIKVQVCTPDKPEVYRIAEDLGIDPDAVTGKLIRIWCWADQQTVDGNAPSVTKALLDRVTGVTGFTDSLVSVGWLVKTDAGYIFPNFSRHNGCTAKTRALGAKRSENLRESRKSNGGSVTKSARNAQQKRCDSVTREEKRREEQSPTEIVLNTCVETDRTGVAPVSSDEDPNAFAVLSCNAAEWSSVFNEIRVPESLSIYQNDILTWGRHLRAQKGPNFDPSVLQSHLQEAVGLGRKLPSSVSWAIDKRKDKLAEPKFEPAEKIDFELWHQMRLAFDVNKVPKDLADSFGEPVLHAWIKLAKRTLKDNYEDEEQKRGFAHEFLSATGTELAEEFFTILKELDNG